MIQYRVVTISEGSNVGELRRLVVDLAKKIGLSDEDAGRLSIICNEMSTNILKHAGCSGKVAVKEFTRDKVKGIEVISIDSGNGIKNMGLALKDGFSTSGSMGAGLGAIKRLSDEFDIYSQPEKGTIVVSKILQHSNLNISTGINKKVDFGAFSMAKQGEEVCGDEWIVKRTKDGAAILVSDGLGHGEGAAQTSREAVGIFKASRELFLEDMMFKIHQGLTGTRGAAISIADLDFSRGKINYIGIGNISGRIFDYGKYQSCISNEGIVGANLRKLQTFTYEFPEGSVFVMNTDGFTTNINLNNYPGLLNKVPSLIAGLIYRDFSRGNDDMAVVVVRNSKSR